MGFALSDTDDLFMSSDLQQPLASATNSEPTPSPPAAAESGDAKSALPRVVAVASRSPIVRTDNGWEVAPGGLARIVKTALDERGGAWVAWNGRAAESPPQQIPDASFDTYTFNLSRTDGDGFYAGYANRSLWPILHDAIVPAVFKADWWEAYVEATNAFTLATSVAVDRVPDCPTLWIHDYHLFLVPERLRAAGLSNPIAFFLHTPFPSPTVFGRLPQRAELLRGVSGANVVGFQTEGDRKRFLETWSRYGVGDPPGTIVAPASIDTTDYRLMVKDPAVLKRAERLQARFADKVLLFGIERLDYTKGIPERLRGLERLFERRTDLRKRLVYVQIASPSRERLPEYRRIRVEVEREIGRLNGRFTAPGGEVPFRYLHRSISQEQLMAYFIAADAALVTPLQDGMNLVAKEYVIAQSFAKAAGALVLSEFAGAASELTDAVLCNPYDVDGTADAIEQAIEMSEDERRKRLSVMAVQIENNDVHHWADQQLRTAELSAGPVFS